MSKKLNKRDAPSVKSNHMVLFSLITGIIKEKIEHWLLQINDETVLPPDIVAFNFGLFESENEYCIYMIGSRFYDEFDDDWACDIDFEPNRKYLMLTSESIQNMSWEKILYEVKNVISSFITANACKLPLFVGKIITIGFDDGDLVRIQ